MMVKSGLVFFLEILLAPSELPAFPDSFFLHWAAATLKGLVESFCCKKSPNQEIGLRRFSEYWTSEGFE